MKRFLQTLRVCLAVYKARARGRYVITHHELDRHDRWFEYAVYEYNGMIWCIPTVEQSHA